MNERIRELHKQVMRWNDTPDCSYNAEFCVPEEYTQKLAELIVRECMMLCGAVYGASEHVRGKNDAFGLGAEKCKVLIKEHFGVEE